MKIHPSGLRFGTFVVPVLVLCVRSVRILHSGNTVLVQSQHGHIQYPWMFSFCYFVFANFDCKLTVFLIRHTKKAPFLVMSSQQLKSLWYKSVLYSCWFIYPANFSFSSLTFPNSLCYNFPCIRGCLESLLARRFKTFIIWINEVVAQRHFF